MADEQIPTFQAEEDTRLEQELEIQGEIPVFNPSDEFSSPTSPPEEFNEIPIFIPDTPDTEGEGGIFRALPEQRFPFEQDMRGAFMHGMIQDTITGQLALQGDKLLKEQFLQQEFEVPEFVAKTPGEKVARFVGSFFDPALGPLSKPAKFVVGPLLKPGAKLTANLGQKIGLNKALRKAAFRAAATGITGSVQFGTFGGTAEALRQGLSDEDFDPELIASQAVAGAATGMLLNPAMAAVGRRLKKGRVKRQLKAKARFEEPTAAPALSGKKVQEAGNLINTLDSLDNNLQRGIQRLEQGGLNQIEERKLRQSILKTEWRKSQKENDFIDTINGEEFALLRQQQQAMSKAKVKIDGKPQTVWKNQISPRDVVTTPEEMNFYSGLNDRTKISATTAFTEDVVRLTHEVDNTIRGRVMREVVEPSMNANTARLVEEQAIKKTLDQMQKRLPDRSKKRLAQLFDHAEGAVQLKDLKNEEIDFLNFMNRTYSGLIDRVNEVNSRYNLRLIKKRQNYVTHLVDMTNEFELAMRPGEIASKKATTFPFEIRTGGPTRKNPIESVEAYIGPALRRIHMTGPASDAMARVQYMPTKLRKAYTNWIEGPILGGIDPKDKLFVNQPHEFILKGAEWLSGQKTAAVINGSLNVTVQQPSQTIATMFQTGATNAIRGLGQAFKDVPEEIRNKSNFLAARSIFQDTVAIKKPKFKDPRDFLASIVEYADRYFARSSWNSAFIQGREKLQLSPDAAIRYADIMGMMLHANYRELYKPPLLRGRTGKAFFPFQSFAFNMWNHLARDPKVLAELRNTSRARETMKVLGAMLATNQVYDAIGLEGPFRMGLETIPLVGGAKFGIPSPPIDRAFKEVQGLIGIQDADAAKVKRSILGNMYLAWAADDQDIRDRAMTNLVNIGAEDFVKMGLQLKNTYEGLEAVQEGYYEVGKDEIDIEGLDKITAILLGPRKTSAFRELRKEQKQEKREKLLGK